MTVGWVDLQSSVYGHSPGGEPAEVWRRLERIRTSRWVVQVEAGRGCGDEGWGLDAGENQQAAGKAFRWEGGER